jgi:DNA modification methylase
VGFLDEACTIRCSGIDTETHINWKGQVVKCHRNDHPTVKPVEHCRWLGTLLLPPESIKPRRLLMPFAGTGSEMIGALEAGWDEVVGIEQDAHYCEIAKARIAHAEAQPCLFEPKPEQLEFVGASGN